MVFLEFAVIVMGRVASFIAGQRAVTVDKGLLVS